MAKNDPFWRLISKSQKHCKHRCDHRLCGNYRHKNNLTLFYAKKKIVCKRIRYSTFFKRDKYRHFCLKFCKGVNKGNEVESAVGFLYKHLYWYFFLLLHKPQQWNQFDNPRNLTFIHKFPNPNSKHIFDNFEVYPHIFEKEVTIRKFLVRGMP